ncbi:MAG: hypothetical protein ACODTL_11890 [Brucella sp.]
MRGGKQIAIRQTNTVSQSAFDAVRHPWFAVRCNRRHLWSIKLHLCGLTGTGLLTTRTGRKRTGRKLPLYFSYSLRKIATRIEKTTALVPALATSTAFQRAQCRKLALRHHIRSTGCSRTRRGSQLRKTKQSSQKKQGERFCHHNTFETHNF